MRASHHPAEAATCASDLSRRNAHNNFFCIIQFQLVLPFPSFQSQEKWKQALKVMMKGYLGLEARHETRLDSMMNAAGAWTHSCQHEGPQSQQRHGLQQWPTGTWKALRHCVDQCPKQNSGVSLVKKGGSPRS